MAIKSVGDEPGSLLIATHNLLTADKRSTLELYKESGIPFYWLVQFKANRSLTSNVNRVQFLYEFLSGKKLDV